MIQRQLFRRALTLPGNPVLVPSVRVMVQRRLASGQMPKLTGPADNAFNRESVALPALILASLNAWNLYQEHWEHWETLPPLEERIEYDYMNIRNKKFPWGDGDKTLL
ncbi:MAG: hypothetical protein Q9219_003047 [cf. Caloplaca sp. 3 TL-2023]